MTDHFRVAILIVGFRNAQDVCQCLASLSLSSQYPLFDVFVCENGGSGAFEEVSNALSAPEGPCTSVEHFDEPGLSTSSSEHLAEIKCLALKGRPSRVFIGRALCNLGYAGGINAWLARLLPSEVWGGFWILNPDTQPEPNALSALVDRSITGKKGMVGSTIVRSDNLNQIYCRGGHHWRKFKTNTAIIGFGDRLDGSIDVPQVEAALDCVSGASMYVTRGCVEKIGLMDERFFLYYEDADWSMRAKSQGLGYAPASVVVHTQGTTIGSATLRSERSQLSVYLESRNHILFVRLHWWRFLVLAYLIGLAHAAAYLLARSRKNFLSSLRGLLAATRGETGRPQIALESPPPRRTGAPAPALIIGNKD